MRAISSPSRHAGGHHSHQNGAAAAYGGSGSGSSSSGVQVMIRVRPPLPRELMYDSGVDARPPHDIKVYNTAQEFSGRYHHVFGEDTPQAAVYEKVRDCVPLALDGYNSTIFAYGQTGTGKTFTMMGDDPSVEAAGSGSGSGSAPGLGIIPRAVKELFREAKAKQDAEGAAIQVIVSYMEIYNDRLHDLLQPYKPNNTRDPADVNQKRALLEVREDAKGNTYVPNLLCVKVKSYKSVYQLIAKGNRNRAVRHTEMNQASSRSHAILQLVIEQWPNGGADGTVLRSKLNFVDLAGSERWNTAAAAAAGAWGEAATDFMGEDRINEMTAINGSLSALGSVVAALTEGRSHVPYRDSRLTHLLQDSLGGNCRTTVLATLSPSADAFEESCSTLRFADRARAIANNPVVNASRDMGSILALKEREIQRLRNMLSQYTGTGRPPTSGEEGGADAARLAEELEETRRALQMERQLRSELQQRLHGGTAGGGEGEGDGAAADGAMDGTTRGVLSGGSSSAPSTAFDGAGSGAGGQLPRPGSMRSSAGSAGSAAAAACGADFFRVSTPSTPLNSVPAHLSSSAGGNGTTPSSSSSVLTPTRSRGGGVPPLGRSRSNLPLGGGGGRPGAGGAGPGVPSPDRRRCDMRRLSFDEAIMSIKSQIINLSAQQERARLRARQPPPQRAFWGRLPPPGPPGQPLLPPPPPGGMTSSTTALPPGSLNVRTRNVVGVYGNGNGPHGGAQSPGGRRHQGHHHGGRPPALTVAPGVVGSAAVGGNGSLSQIPSIDMTESPTGSDVASPGSFGGAGKPVRQHQHSHLRGNQLQQGQESPSGGSHAPYGRSRGGGRGAPPPDEEEDVVSDEVPDEEVVEEEEDGDGGRAGRGGGGGGGGGARAREAGGGRRAPAAASDADSEDEADGDDDGDAEGAEDDGLSQLDADEYEELMREAREALAKAGGGGGAAAGKPAAASAGRGQVAVAPSGGGGGGRSALLQQPSTAPPALGSGGAVVVTGSGWGRNALLQKFSDTDATPGAAAGGGGGFGRSTLMSAPAPLSPSPLGASAAAPSGAGGWGRRSILAAQSVPAPETPPPPTTAPPALAAATLPPGRRALIAELMADGDDGVGGSHSSSLGPYGAGSPYGKSPQRGRGLGAKGRSKSVGGLGRPGGGSRGNTSDRVAKLDAGSWIYILGASASSTRAKHLASALQLDPRTGLPAL